MLEFTEPAALPQTHQRIAQRDNEINPEPVPAEAGPAEDKEEYIDLEAAQGPTKIIGLSSPPMDL